MPNRQNPYITIRTVDSLVEKLNINIKMHSEHNVKLIINYISLLWFWPSAESWYRFHSG
jgi:hypothetical protein